MKFCFIANTMANLFTQFVLSSFLLSLFSLFQNGTSVSLDEWASSLHDAIAALGREPIIIDEGSNMLPAHQDIIFFKDKLNAFYNKLDNPPKFVLRKKYERRLCAPVFNAYSLCSELAGKIPGTDQIGAQGGEQSEALMAKVRAIIRGLHTDFGTLFAEIAIKSIGKCKWTRKMLNHLLEKLNQIIEFAQQNGSYCEMAPFEQAKSVLKSIISQGEETKRTVGQNRKQVEHIVEELVVETKLDIWLNEVNAKMINYETPFVDIRGFMKFSHDLSTELGQINASVCKWPNSMEKKGQLSDKIRKLICVAMEKSHFLKQIIVQKLDGLLNKATNAIEELKTELEEAKRTEEMGEKEEKFKQFNRKIIEIYSNRAMHMPDQVDHAVFNVLKRTKEGQLLFPVAFEEMQKVIENEKKSVIDAFWQQFGEAEAAAEGC